MIRVIINGAAGRMGHEVEARVNADPALEIAALVDRAGQGERYYTSLSDFTGEADVIIDFSHHSATAELMEYARRRKIPVLVATTAHTPDEMELIRQAASDVAVFNSANMSIGVAVLADLAKKAALAMPDADIEIVETHHNRKLDAPSGTALMLANVLTSVREKARLVLGRGSGKREKEDIGISSVRRGNIVGIHEILISTDNETLTLKHEAHSRALFADGAVAAAKFLAGKPAGAYTMDDMVK